jgi:hypothetical protein
LARHRKDALALLATLLLASGCAHYWVPERTLDAYATVPRPQRKPVIVAATRASDGKATFIRASEAAPEPLTDGSGADKRRRVRVFRPLTVSGLVLLSTGAALLAAGIGVALAPPPRDCSGVDTCGMLGNFLAGMPIIATGGLELSLGAIFTGVGAATGELRQPHPPKYQLLQP